MDKRCIGVVLAVAALATVGAPSPAQADFGEISASTIGIANITPDYYGVAFTAGEPGATISSVTFALPFGFFNFDGATSFMNATAPVLDLPSLSGLSAGDISFSFIGNQPPSLTVNFAPGSFGIGDSFHFGADVEGLGSKIGGVFGGVGATFSATLGSGLSGTAPFRTDTSVASFATLTVPEPSSFVLSLIYGVAGLTVWRKRLTS